MSIARPIKCKINNCAGNGHKNKNGKSYFEKGFCTKHYAKYIKYGDALSVAISRAKRSAIIKNDIALIPLGVQGKQGFAVVDRDMAKLDEHKFVSKSIKDLYPVTTIKNKTVRLHTLIMGSADDGMVVDHINRNPLDNRRSNLRFVTVQGNAQNTGPKSGSSSKYKGVSFYKQSGKWRAQISHNNKSYSLGIHNTQEQAALAYNNAAIKYQGECAYLNDV